MGSMQTFSGVFFIGGEDWGEGYVGGSFHGEDNFYEGGGGLDFPELLKKQSEIKFKKQVFSTENKEQH